MQFYLKPREKLNVCQNGYSYRTILMESAIRNTDFIWLILPITAIIFHSGESLLKFVVNWRMRFFISDKVVGLHTQPLYFCIIIQTYFGPLFQEKEVFLVLKNTYNIQNDIFNFSTIKIRACGSTERGCQIRSLLSICPIYYIPSWIDHKISKALSTISKLDSLYMK